MHCFVTMEIIGDKKRLDDSLYAFKDVCFKNVPTLKSFCSKCEATSS